jgi:Flp pilus assembly protein TadD
MTTQELIDYANSLVPCCLTPTQRQKFFLPPSKADNLLEQGKQLAKDGEITAAIAQFKQAKTLAPCFKFNPETQAKQLAAQTRINQGKTWAKEGKVLAAVAEFQRALAIKPDNPGHYAQQLAFPTFSSLPSSAW